MINRKPQSFVLYFVGIVLLLFGQRSFWEKYKEGEKQIEQQKKQEKEAEFASNKPFETQEVVYDSIKKTWKNSKVYFQTIHVGNVNFKAMKASKSKSNIESHDEENASDSL